jgi:aspartyl-tRNA(Asn)/glutamyl-tRNA(Gln) amidotransferase subunit A
MDDRLAWLTIADAARAIRARELSPVELTRALIERIEALDPQLDAFLTLTAERALDDAHAAEAEIASGGWRGPLHGVPFGLKDIYETAGIRTTAHSRLLEHYVPAADATTVARLRDAGAVLLGKLATHEFAHGGPSFDLPWPPARNPWNREHFTGGSSSGSGAAVAAGLLPLALGSDTGGSIRNPAALCGLVGLKATYGLVSRRGVIANSYSYDHAGPLTRTVEDAAIALQALAGHDPLDPASADVPVPDYRAGLDGDIRGLRIGAVRHFHETDLRAPDALRAAFDAAVDVLRGLGATVEDVQLRPLRIYQDIKVTAAESELFSVHAANLRARPGDFGEDFLARSLPACLLTAAHYLHAQRERRAVLAEMRPIYERFDVLLTAGPGPAPPLGGWRVIEFWKQGSLAAPFSVTGGPALVQCMGFTEAGLPLSLQIAGRPFDDATVLRAAHAYERATGWTARHPRLDPAAAFSRALPPVPDPEPYDATPAERAAAALACRRAGLTLTERQMAMVLAAAPHVEAMTARIARRRDWYEEPVNVFSA